MVRNHLVPAFGDKRLGKITKADVERYLVSKQAGTRRGKSKKSVPLSSRTINYTNNVLRFIQKDAVENRLLESNPATKVKPLPDNGTHERARVLAPDQLSRLLEAAEQPWRMLWLLLAHAGLRRGEALGVEWQDIDLEAAAVEIRRSVGRVRNDDHTRWSRSRSRPGDLMTLFP